MNETDTTITIGNTEISDFEASGVKCHREEDISGEWITGEIAFSSRAGMCGQAIDYSIRCACWSDTDDDNDSWCADMEGARVIMAIVGMDAKDIDRDTEPSQVIHLFPAECERLGHRIVAVLRAALEAAKP